MKLRALGASAVALFFSSSLVGPLSGSPRGLTDVAGRWTIVRNEGAVGTLDLGRGPDRRSAERRALEDTLLGTAVTGGEHLFVAYRATSTPGVVGALDRKKAPQAASSISVYEYDEVEGAFRGTHANRAESLRRAAEGNAVDLYVDGHEMFPSYLAAIASAKETVHCECYEWADDDVGGRVGAALMERARAGVKVRVIMDGIASRKASGLASRMKAAGCEVRLYNPIGLGAAKETLAQLLKSLVGKESLSDPIGNSWKGLDNRDHRKTLTVDGRVAFVGGMNLAHEYIHEWHDVHSRVRGPAVASVQRHFVDTWRRMGGAISEAGLYPPLEKAGSVAVDVATTLPGIRDELKRVYLSRVNAAKREVFLLTPFFGDPELEKSLAAAVARGVRVVLILPEDDRNSVALMGAYHARIKPGLIALGVEVRAYPKMTHGKVAVIDGEWATIGSCNLENRSFNRDLEENVSIEDARFAGEVRARVFEADFKVSRLCRVGDPVDGFMRRVFGKIGGMFLVYL